MPITLMELVLIVALLAMAVGFALVRSARPREPGDGTGLVRQACPNPRCRHANEERAVFCARCGTRMNLQPNGRD